MRMLWTILLLAVPGSLDAAWAAAGPTFVGVASCAGCHVAETQAWRGSQHDQAMQEATPATVLGDFTGASFAKDGVTSRFYRRGDRFYVETDGPDGALQEYPVDYTFGVYPLQQYLVAFPGGRWQALPLAWDARPKEQGGQRWFHLYPGEKIGARDELHWTGINQNWNWMCADCHSTDLRRGYDLESDSYHTTWSALNVSCEACHGPGSGHVAWARDGGTAFDPAKGLTVRLDDRGAASWQFAEGARIARRSPPLASHVETEVCAPCHARRSPLGDGHEIGKPLLDGYRPQLLDPGLYHANGQMDGEVYNYGSFLQSKMYAAGVTCSNCHEPHSLKLRAEGNTVCAQCHQPSAFDTAAHHFHTPGEPGSRCVDCHMPAKTYMVVDPRHDHGFRVPRPDLATRTASPDVCASCHEGKDPAWSAARIAEWYGPDRRREPMFGEALAADRSALPGAAQRLVKLADDPAASAIARATAVAALEHRLDERTVAAVQRGIGDRDAMVRLAAVSALANVDPRLRARLLLPLVGDPVRAVRLEAARVLAPVPTLDLPQAQRAQLEAAFAEYESAQSGLLDRPEGLVTLANFYRDRGRLPEAEARFQDVTRLYPSFAPAYANLADLLRQQSRDEDGERVLKQGMAVMPGSAELQHAYGLLLIRQKKYREAVAALGKAADLAPNDARFAYVYAVALQDSGRPGEAAAVLERAHAGHPNDPDILFSLAAVLLQQGDLDSARRYAQELVRVAPGYPNARELLRAVDPTAG
jgi:predicted CXXCH cytochrome family protein